MALLETLQDAFDNSSFDTGLWSQAGLGTVTETTSLNLTPNTNFTAIHVYSNSSYDLTSSYGFLKYTTSANQYDNILALVDSVFAAANGLYWRVDKDTGNIYASTKISSSNADVASATFVPATHRWLRIRNSGSNILWDYATDADPATWVNFTSTPTPITITALFVDILAIPNTTFGTTQVNNFNIGATPPVTMAGGLYECRIRGAKLFS